MTEDRYQRLSVSQKQARHRAAMREPDIECPLCGVRTSVADLLRHVDATCPRRRIPHPLARWVTWTEALELGVPKATMLDWVRRGVVQMTGAPKARRYLLRDLVRLLAIRRGSGS